MTQDTTSLEFTVHGPTLAQAWAYVGMDGSLWRARMLRNQAMHPLPVPLAEYGPFIRGCRVRLHPRLFSAAAVALGDIQREVAARAGPGREPSDLEPLLNALVDAHVRKMGGRGAMRAMVNGKQRQAVAH